MRIGLLTGGGDCPGLNAAIRAVVKRAVLKYGHAVVGFRGGWRGVVEGNCFNMVREDVRNILPQGGTILGTGRYHPNDEPDGIKKVVDTLEEENIDSLICIGGDGTTYAASEVAKAGVKVISIPKTIDNDVYGTEMSIGYETALNIATEAIDRLHTTAESHHRIMVLEVMGRTSGWIAVAAGLAGGAEIILTPEVPFDIEEVCKKLIRRHKSYANFSIVVVAEGAEPKEGSDMEYKTKYDNVGAIVAGSIGSRITEEIQNRTSIDTRLTVLGHVQRGGSPTPNDRNLASAFGVAAVDALVEGKSNVLTAWQDEKVVLVPFEEIAGKVRHVSENLLKTADALM